MVSTKPIKAGEQIVSLRDIFGMHPRLTSDRHAVEYVRRPAKLGSPPEIRAR